MNIPALTKAKEDLNNFIGAWNGEDKQFIYWGNVFNEDDISCAEEAIKKIEELQEILADLKI